MDATSGGKDTRQTKQRRTLGATAAGAVKGNKDGPASAGLCTWEADGWQDQGSRFKPIVAQGRGSSLGRPCLHIKPVPMPWAI